MSRAIAKRSSWRVAGAGVKFITKYASGRPWRSIHPIHQCTGSFTAPVVPVLA